MASTVLYVTRGKRLSGLTRRLGGGVRGLQLQGMGLKLVPEKIWRGANKYGCIKVSERGPGDLQLFYFSEAGVALDT